MRYSTILEGCSYKYLPKQPGSSPVLTICDENIDPNIIVNQDTNSDERSKAFHALSKEKAEARIKRGGPISVGDIVKVGIQIQEGKKKRVQPYSGTVIALHGNGVSSTITVRRIFQGVGIERIFLMHSPALASVEVIRKSCVRRAKLYYLRDRVGKSARLKTKLV